MIPEVCAKRGKGVFPATTCGVLFLVSLCECLLLYYLLLLKLLYFFFIK